MINIHIIIISIIIIIIISSSSSSSGSSIISMISTMNIIIISVWGCGAHPAVGIDLRVHRIRSTGNLRTNLMDFRGLDSSTVLSLRGGTLMSIGHFLKS